MRDYGVVRVRFWAWAKRKKLSVEARDLALYLLTSPHGNSLGCFRLPMAYLCDDLDANSKAAAKTLEELAAVGFLVRDEDDGWTWIRDYLEHNPIPNGNVGKAVGKLLEQVPSTVSFYPDLLAAMEIQYVDADLIETLLQRYANRSDTVVSRSKTHTQTHEHEHDQEHDQDQTQEHNPVACASAGDVERAFRLFNDSAARTGWPAVQKMDPDRKRAMAATLKEVDGVEGFAIALGKAEASKFLTVDWPNFNLDWMLKPKNFRKLMEGNYDTRHREDPAARSVSAGLAGIYEAGSR